MMICILISNPFISIHHHSINFDPNHTKFTIATVYEQNIRDVIVAVENGEKQGIAAAAFNVHPSILSRRLRGATNYKASKIDAQKLSPI